jgi:hypothetical protein
LNLKRGQEKESGRRRREENRFSMSKAEKETRG